MAKIELCGDAGGSTNHENDNKGGGPAATEGVPRAAWLDSITSVGAGECLLWPYTRLRLKVMIASSSWSLGGSRYITVSSDLPGNLKRTWRFPTSLGRLLGFGVFVSVLCGGVMNRSKGFGTFTDLV